MRQASRCARAMAGSCRGRTRPSMNASKPICRGLGISAGLEAGLARDLAVNCERLGYHSLWSNDEPAAAGLEMLAQFAAAAPRLELGVGVLPLDRHQPVAIAAEIARLGLDPAKLWVGVGSGQLRAPLDLVRRAVAELRELLPDGTRIVVAAMRPQLCRAWWRNRRRCAAQLDAACPSGDGASMGAGRSGPGGTGRPARRFVCPCRRGPRRAAAAPRRGEPLPQHQ